MDDSQKKIGLQKRHLRVEHHVKQQKCDELLNP
jgi:hypothetical protein